MTTNVSIEIKVNSYEDELFIHNLADKLSFNPVSKYKTYGYQTLNYKVSRLDVKHVKAFWTSVFEDCRICTF